MPSLSRCPAAEEPHRNGHITSLASSSRRQRALTHRPSPSTHNQREEGVSAKYSVTALHLKPLSVARQSAYFRRPRCIHRRASRPPRGDHSYLRPLYVIDICSSIVARAALLACLYREASLYAFDILCARALATPLVNKHEKRRGRSVYLAPASSIIAWRRPWLLTAKKSRHCPPAESTLDTAGFCLVTRLALYASRRGASARKWQFFYPIHSRDYRPSHMSYRIAAASKQRQ